MKMFRSNLEDYKFYIYYDLAYTIWMFLHIADILYFIYNFQEANRETHKSWQGDA